MTEVQPQISKKKDTKVEQWADTTDPFVNAIYKKLRNKKKKLEKIEQTELKIKKGEIVPNEEQKQMLANKEPFIQEMKELEGILLMYKEAFPDNPVFATAGKKKDKIKNKQEQEVPQKKEEVDVSKEIEQVLKTLANVVIMGAVGRQFEEELPGVSKNLGDALGFLYNSFENLTGVNSDNFVWSAARDEFVENFLKLATKSQMQVGHHTHQSFADVEAFVRDFLNKDKVYQHKMYSRQAEQEEVEQPENQESPKDLEEDKEEGEGQVEDEQQVEAGETQEGQQEEQKTRPQKQYQKREWIEDYDEYRRLKNQGFIRKNKVDDEGFTMTGDKREEHYRGGRGRGGYRGGRGGRGDRGRGGRGDRGDRGRGDYRGRGDRKFDGDRPQGGFHRGRGQLRTSENATPVQDAGNE